MRLPGHEEHDTAACDACAVFDQVHAERDDLLLRVAQLDRAHAPKTPEHKAKIGRGARTWWNSAEGLREKAIRREKALARRLETLKRIL